MQRKKQWREGAVCWRNRQERTKKSQRKNQITQLTPRKHSGGEAGHPHRNLERAIPGWDTDLCKGGASQCYRSPRSKCCRNFRRPHCKPQSTFMVCNTISDTEIQNCGPQWKIERSRDGNRAFPQRCIRGKGRQKQQETCWQTQVARSSRWERVAIGHEI